VRPHDATHADRRRHQRDVQLSGLCILLVDDDPQICRMMQTILVSQHFVVTVSRNGSEAVDKLRCAKYDLVLLDVNMPGLNGIDTCKTMRAASDVPIIMLTVRAAERDKAEAFEAGASDYVTKPFKTTELLAVIRTVLKIEA
jgi:DNA-binding response OmpR family regulator